MVEKIKAEIERLRKANEVSEDKEYAQYELDVACGYDDALNDLLSFIESLLNEKPFPNWRHIDEEKPKQGQDCACVSVTYDGDIKYNNFADGPWYWDGNGKLFSDSKETGVFIGHNDWGDKETHSCSYWMPWDELFDALEKPLKEKVNDRENQERN